MPPRRSGGPGPFRRRVGPRPGRRLARPETASSGASTWIVGVVGLASLAAAGYMLWNESRGSAPIEGYDLVRRVPVALPERATGPASVTREANPGEPVPVAADIALDRLAIEAAVAGATGERAASARKAESSAVMAPVAAENKLFTLELSGTLADQALDSKDPQTWARLGYCLTQECPARHWLVFPDGGIPIIKPPSGLAGAAKGKPAASPPPPAGDRRRPTFRLVLEAKAQAAGKIVFYGREMASKYECRLTCAIEKRSAGAEDFVRLHVVTAEEKISPAKDAKESPAALLRLCYDSALDRLAANLKGHAFFAAGTSAPVGPKKRAAQPPKQP